MLRHGRHVVGRVLSVVGEHPRIAHPSRVIRPERFEVESRDVFARIGDSLTPLMGSEGILDERE